MVYKVPCSNLNCYHKVHYESSMDGVTHTPGMKNMLMEVDDDFDFMSRYYYCSLSCVAYSGNQKAIDATFNPPKPSPEELKAMEERLYARIKEKK